MCVARILVYNTILETSDMLFFLAENLVSLVLIFTIFPGKSVVSRNKEVRSFYSHAERLRDLLCRRTCWVRGSSQRAAWGSAPPSPTRPSWPASSCASSKGCAAIYAFMKRNSEISERQEIHKSFRYISVRALVNKLPLKHRRKNMVPTADARSQTHEICQ